MTAPKTHAESVYAVVVGNFNPKIVEPLWLSNNGLVPEFEAEAAERQLIDGDFSHVVLPWADLTVIADRMQLESREELINKAQLQDLAVSILRLLPHTPISLISIQHRIIVVANSEQQRHEVGHRLAPKALWDGVLDSPGMFDFAMQGTRCDEYQGATRVRIRPEFEPGWSIWINVNEEVALKDPDKPEAGSRAADLVQKLWPEAERRTLEIRSKLYERLFD